MEWKLGHHATVEKGEQPKEDIPNYLALASGASYFCWGAFRPYQGDFQGKICEHGQL